MDCKKFTFSALILLLALILLNCSPSSQRKEYVLENGLRVIFLNRESPVTSALILIRSSDTKEGSRLTQGTSDLLLEGTEVRTKEQVYREIESLGGRLGSETLLSVSLLYVQAPQSTFHDCFKIFFECLTQPSFDEDHIEGVFTHKKKQAMLSFLIKHHRKVDEDIRKIMFKDTEECSGTEQQDSIPSRDDILQHYRTLYRPDNCVLVIVGRFEGNDIVKAVSRDWGKDGKTVKFQYVDCQKIELDLPYEKVIKSKSQFDRVLIGYYAPFTLTEPFFSMLLLKTMLASGKSSLFQSRFIVEGHPDFQASARYHDERPYGFLVFEIETPPGEGIDAKRIVFDELDRIKLNGIPVEALNNAKRKDVSELLLSYQYTLRVALLLAYSSFLDSPYMSVDALEHRIKNVEVLEAEKTADTYLKDPVVLIYRSHLAE